jgi:hypothetical protein
LAEIKRKAPGKDLKAGTYLNDTTLTRGRSLDGRQCFPGDGGAPVVGDDLEASYITGK